MSGSVTPRKTPRKAFVRALHEADPVVSRDSGSGRCCDSPIRAVSKSDSLGDLGALAVKESSAHPLAMVEVDREEGAEAQTGVFDASSQ